MSVSPDLQKTLVPEPWQGFPDQSTFKHMEWLKELDSSVYLALWQRWPTYDLPVGHDAYLVSFHLEAVDVDWLDRQCTRIQAPIVVLFDGSYYDYPHADNLYPVPYFYWHHQIELMHQWFGKDFSPMAKTHKASAFCSRITQSKLLIFTGLAEYMGTDQCLLSLSNWLEEQNVHCKMPTGNTTLDAVSDIFWSKYWGKIFKIDDYNTLEQNFQNFTSNFYTDAYQRAAIHFTNESYHYSLMNGRIRPGPFLTEKTWKPLAAGQPFIPVGQFETYRTLEKLGFQFDYGFDTTWDLDPGNLTRLESIIGLIKDLSAWSIDEIDYATKESTTHNLEHINSGNFAKTCEKHNRDSINQVLDLLK